jgi:uncharacterized membrane protein
MLGGVQAQHQQRIFGRQARHFAPANNGAAGARQQILRGQMGCRSGSAPETESLSDDERDYARKAIRDIEYSSRNITIELPANNRRTQTATIETDGAGFSHQSNRIALFPKQLSNRLATP